MPLQILAVKLDGITAGDYLTWCRDPEPPALDFALRSISIDADPLGDTITASLDWKLSPPRSAMSAAAAAGLPVPAGAEIHALLTDRSHASRVETFIARTRSCGDSAGIPYPGGRGLGLELPGAC